MPEIKLENVTKRWGKFYSVDHLNLDIPDNAFVTILGPSGCGKTTTLRMIAGLETPTSGKITIGDKVVFDSNRGINIPANKRRVGFLFQNYALWPNMTVYENISFGLKNVKEEMAVIDFEAKAYADLARVFDSPKKILELTEECREKDGTLDQKKACLKYIDAFLISLDTAKKVYEKKIHEAADPAQAALQAKSEYERKYAEAVKAHEAKGETVRKEDFHVLKDGQELKAVRRLSREEVDLAVRRVSRIVKIGMFMDRYPAELSGGQQQRVAIARTLAPQPQVMFMDEPLSNLDAKLRLEMRYELQRLHVETGSTFVYVTHDQMEAMTLSTKICLINNGVLQQYDVPLTLYNRPNNLFAADFVGNPSINFVEAHGVQKEDGSFEFQVLDNKRAVFRPAEKLDLQEWFQKRDREEAEAGRIAEERLQDKEETEKENKDERFEYHVARVNEEDYSLKEEPVITEEDFVIGIRPEMIKVEQGGTLKATVYGAMPTGMESTLKLKVGEYLLTCVVFGGVTYPIGSEVTLAVEGKDVLLYDRKSEKLITSGSLVISD